MLIEHFLVNVLCQNEIKVSLPALVDPKCALVNENVISNVKLSINFLDRKFLSIKHTLIMKLKIFIDKNFS